jgi:type IV pilus assembly protein PilE
MEAIAMSAPTSRSRSRGITLIELMIVVLVVAILAGISIPSYRQYVMRVTRTDAKRDLLQMASALERCFTRFTAYNDAGCPAVGMLPMASNEGGTYEMRVDNFTATTFTLIAVPLGGQLGDTKCGSFTLTQAGVQGVTGTQTAQQCWSGR